MAILVAPVVAQLSMLLEPEGMLVGLAVKELIVGLLGGWLAGFTVTVSVDVAEPAAFVAVSVYAVVAVGLMLVEPLASVDVNVPGVMATLAAPVTDQLRELLVPELMLMGAAVKDAICGMEFFAVGVLAELPEPQPARPAQEMRARTSAQSSSADEPRPRRLSLFLQNELGKSMRNPPLPLALVDRNSLGNTGLICLLAISTESGPWSTIVTKVSTGI